MKVTSYQNKLHLILEALIFLTAFSIPFSSAFNSICFAILFLFSFYFFDKESFLRKITKREAYVYYILFFLVQLLSLTYSKNTSLGIETIQHNVVFIIIPIIFINLKEQIDERKIKIAYLGLLFSLLLTLITSLTKLLCESITTEIGLTDFFRESFMNKGLYNIHVPYLSLLIVFTIIFTSQIKFSISSRLNTIIKSSVILFLFISLLLLSGMMSLVVLTIFITTLFLTSKISTQTKIGGVILAVLLSVFTINYIKSYKKIDRVKGSEHMIYRMQKIITTKDSVRMGNWESVIKVISKHPFLGVSASGGLELLQKEREVLSESYINKHNAHNDFLEIMLRYGLLGLIAYILLLIKLFKNAWKENKYIFKWFLIIFIISGLTETFLQRQIGLAFFVFFSMLLYTFNPKEA